MSMYQLILNRMQVKLLYWSRTPNKVLPEKYYLKFTPFTENTDFYVMAAQHTGTLEVSL